MLWRAGPAVQPARSAQAGGAAAGGAAAGRDGGHGRYHDGLPLRRSRHLGCQPGGYDQQPHHRAVCGAGHRRRGGGQPVSGCKGAEARQCKLGSADPAQRSAGRGCGGVLLCAGPSHDPAVLWQHRCRRTGGRCALPAHHGGQLPVPGHVQCRCGALPQHGQLQNLHADQHPDEHHQHRGQCGLHLCTGHGRGRCCLAQCPFPCCGGGAHPEPLLPEGPHAHRAQNVSAGWPDGKAHPGHRHPVRL